MTFPLDVDKGVTWAAQWPVLEHVEGSEPGPPIDITGWKAYVQVRESVDAEELLHEWSTDKGNAIAGHGFLRIFVDYAESLAWTWEFGYYDVVLVSPTGERVKLDEGPIQARTLVSRDIG